MKSEKKIVAEIISLETIVFDDECYLEEADQSRLQTLYEVLGRELNQSEKSEIYIKRLSFMEECIGEKLEDILNKKMYYEH